jgi:nucleotide-binding universal stress UspA family protein
LKITKKNLKTIWAVDLFEGANFKNSELVTTLKYLAEKQNAKIEPVYVLSPESLDLALEFSPPWVKQYKPAAQKSLRFAIEETKISNLLEPRVLLQSKPSLSPMVKTLTRYAKTSGFDLIVLGTHSRKGLSRLFLGSFAESTLLYSKVPVLIVGPHTHVKEFKTILFATDFGIKSKAVFTKALALAKEFHAKITLFHSVSHPIESVIQSGAFLLGGGWVDLPEYMNEIEQLNRKRADQWCAQAKNQGVEVKVVFMPSGGNVPESIVKYAQNHAIDLIAIGAESGPVASTLMGSISRQVVRNSHCPIWVYRN